MDANTTLLAAGTLFVFFGLWCYYRKLKFRTLMFNNQHTSTEFDTRARTIAVANTLKTKSFHVSDWDQDWRFPQDNGIIAFDVKKDGGLLIALTNQMYTDINEHPFEGIGIVLDNGDRSHPESWIGLFPNPTAPADTMKGMPRNRGWQMNKDKWNHVEIIVFAQYIEVRVNSQVLLTGEYFAPQSLKLQFIGFGSIGRGTKEGYIHNVQLKGKVMNPANFQ